MVAGAPVNNPSKAARREWIFEAAAPQLTFS
jgi:hypothetical protein